MSKYGGMTVNERLFNAGLLDDFDRCIDGLNDAGAAEILTKVELTNEEATAIVQSVRQNPAKFGYPRR